MPQRTSKSSKLHNIAEIEKEKIRKNLLKGLINTLPTEKSQFVRGLLNKNIKERKKALINLTLIDSKKASKLIELGLQDPSPSVRIFSAQLLPLLNSKSSIDKLRPLLTDPNESVRINAALALKKLVQGNQKIKYERLYFGESEKPEFFNPQRRIVRGKLRKSGSKTILLGGSQLNKAIVRIVSKQSYNAWLKALNSREFWKQKGFSYIPVEPILNRSSGKLRASLTKTKRQFKVFSKVIGPSLLEYKQIATDRKMIAKLESDRLNIIRALRELGVEHRHPHRENFCVETVGGIPRLYIIDMDRAKIMPDMYDPFI